MGRGQGAKNNIWGSNGQKFSKFGENYKPTDWKKLNNSQAQKHEEITNSKWSAFFLKGSVVKGNENLRNCPE